MRVLHLNFGYSGGGAERCARELFENLPKLGIETEMWIGRRWQPIPAKVSHLPHFWEAFWSPLEAFPEITDWRHRGSISKLGAITNRQFDLVHLHNIYGGWLSMQALKQLTERFPCVWTLHDEWAPNHGLTSDLTGKLTPVQVKNISTGLLRYLPYNRYHENFRWRRMRSLLKTSLPQPRVVICPSMYLRQKTISSRVFLKSKIVHVPNGTKMPDLANAKMDRTEAKLSFGLSANCPVVLIVAADLADAHKGTAFAIQAVKRLDPLLKTQVLLLGRSAKSLTRRLFPLRSVSAFAHDDITLARAYRASDLTILPSLAENFPYVGLESLACGTPIVAFPVGGMPEMIGKNERGRICETMDAQELASNIEALLIDNEKRVELGIHGATWVKENCGMTDYLGRIAHLYKEVLEG